MIILFVLQRGMHFYYYVINKVILNWLSNGSEVTSDLLGLGLTQLTPDKFSLGPIQLTLDLFCIGPIHLTLDL